MATMFPIPKEFESAWDEVRSKVMGTPPSVMTGTDTLPGHVVDALSKMMFPESPKEAFVGGVMGLAPGYIASNFRTPQQIQQLRKVMAEEMRARGLVGQVEKRVRPFGSGYNYQDMGNSWFPELEYSIPIERSPLLNITKTTETRPNPFEQIARGSWYHGMSKSARANVPVGRLYPDRNWYPETNFLDTANEFGFPISHHDALSMSGGKLGEPSGISLTGLPTKAIDFSDDEFIHRVLPLFGKNPQEALVNLMTPEGRAMLQDAYTTIANQHITPTALRLMARDINTSPFAMMLPGQTNKIVGRNMENWLSNDMGKFNSDLSQELQAQGKRGILYNPKRYDEYEMLMLDPKYVLPLDYRQFQEYSNPNWVRNNRRPPYVEASEAKTATPGVRKGLLEIRDLMTQNHSRLSDIYSERPWKDYLNEVNKNELIQRVNPEYRERVGSELFGPAKSYQIQPQSDIDDFITTWLKDAGG
jgi:hypothetical protein